MTVAEFIAPRGPIMASPTRSRAGRWRFPPQGFTSGGTVPRPHASGAGPAWTRRSGGRSPLREAPQGRTGRRGSPMTSG